MPVTYFSSLSIKLVSLYIPVFPVGLKVPVCPPVRPTVCLYLFLSFGLTDLPVCLFVFQPVCTVCKKVRMKWNWVRMFGGAEKTCDAWPQHLGLDEELSVGPFIVWLLCMTSALIHSKEVRYQINDRFSCCGDRLGHIISLLLPHRGQCRERNLEIFISIPSLALLLISPYFSCYKLHYSNALYKLLCCNISSKASVLGKKMHLV